MPLNQSITPMKDLKKISEVLTNAKKPVKADEHHFGYLLGEKSKMLFKGILDDSFQSDAEATKAIYNGPEKPDKKFLMLKSRLRKKMIEETFFLNPHSQKNSPYESELNEAYRNLSIAKTFLSLGMRKEAIDIIKPLFNTARSYRFTEILFATARMLRYHASLMGTAEEMTFYDSIIEETKNEIEAEIYSEKVIEELNLETRFSYSNRRDLLKKTKDHYDRLVSLLATNKSHILRLNTFRIGIKYNEYLQDFNGLVKVCEACEQYLTDNPQFKQKARLAEMALFKMDACLHLQDYAKGQEYANVCQLYFSKGFPNWFVFMEYFFLLCLQTKNYEAAIKTYSEVTKHVKFKNITPERREKWKLFEAYLHFAIPPELAGKDFKLYKFINEVPIYNRDKKGYNLSILIAQYLLLLKIKDHDRLLLKQESFTSYFKRYVNKKYSYRSYYFTKMLLNVIRSNFNVSKTITISNKFLLKLKARTNRYHGDLESLEVIPYEQLWDEILCRLQVNGEGSQYYIKPQVKRGRKKIPLSKNMAAALRYKEQRTLDGTPVTGLA